MQRKFESYWIFIVDPFDWTMNYGKRVLNNTDIKDQYLHMMLTNLTSLVTSGLISDVSIKPVSFQRKLSHHSLIQS